MSSSHEDRLAARLEVLADACELSRRLEDFTGFPSRIRVPADIAVKAEELRQALNEWIALVTPEED